MSTYRFCGDSQRGKSHEANNTKCQDAFYFLEKAGFIVAAVADGLGSSKHSDVASNMAAKGAVEYCVNNLRAGMQEKDIPLVIRAAFDNVNFAIKHQAGDNLDDYDTTLTLAVFIGGNVYYGHAGDSGIIALRCDGIFEQVTEPQLGDGIGKERPVYPLAAEGHWVFGKYEHRTKALFLMTDGVLNKTVPPLLEDQKYKLDHKYLFYLYDNLCKTGDLSKWISEELVRILPQEINYDDKTLVAVMCQTAKISLQPKKYYDYPNDDLWNGLLEKHKKSLYGYKLQPEDNEALHLPKRIKIVNFIKKDNIRVSQQPTAKKNRPNRKLRSIIVLATTAFTLGVIVTLVFALAINNSNKGKDLISDPPTSSTNPFIPLEEKLKGTVEVNIVKPIVGDILVGTFKNDNNTGTLSYEWRADGERREGGNFPIKGYIVKSSDVGALITLVITSSVETEAVSSTPSEKVKRRKDPIAPLMPELDNEDDEIHDKVILKPNPEYEFAKCDPMQKEPNEDDWDDSNEFDGLVPDTEYRFYQRVRRTDEQEASSASPPLTIKIEFIPEPTSAPPTQTTTQPPFQQGTVTTPTPESTSSPITSQSPEQTKAPEQSNDNNQGNEANAND